MMLLSNLPCNTAGREFARAQTSHACLIDRVAPVQRKQTGFRTLQSSSLGKFQTRRASRFLVTAAASVEELAKKFNITGSVEVGQNKSGLTTVTLSHASGTTAEIYLYGGCVTSWKQPSGDEVLYCRPDAKFDGSKPISGGIPFCFPQFGPGKIQQHGFARNLEWTLSSSSADLQPDDKHPEVTLLLEESEETLKMWPHKFKAVYSVSLHGEQLRTDFRVFNTCDKPFEFTAAMHSYLEVQDIALAKVQGLKGLDFLDKVPDVNNPVKGKEEREWVQFDGPVDSVYLNAPERVSLDVGTGAAVDIVSKGWQDVVVWNPHKAMKECYQDFACVENAQVGKPVTLQPGQDWRAEQEFTVVDN